MRLSINPRCRQLLFLSGVAACLLPSFGPPLALLLGFLIAQTSGNPYRGVTARAIGWILKCSIVGLGFNMNLAQAIETSRDGLVMTISIMVITLLLGSVLGGWFAINKKISFLISVGTAICGGSAIAAVAPILKADEKQISVALGTVFILNSVALFFFPRVGYWIDMSEAQFGLWCAIAIHDTSSVVGAAASYGAEALQVATTVKLGRALWIIPLSLLTALMVREKGTRIRYPFFIGLFILAMASNYYFRQFQPEFAFLAAMAKTGMTITLFLIGAGLSMSELRLVGIRPFLQGTTLWLLVTVISLFTIMLR